MTQAYDRALAPAGLRATQFSLLQEAERLGPIAIMPLAEAMAMDRATLGHNLRPMEAMGYVRLDVGLDRRSRDVSITEAGRRLLASAMPLWRDAQAAFEAEIGVAEARRLRALLLRVSRSRFGP